MSYPSQPGLLCDAVLRGGAGSHSLDAGQATPEDWRRARWSEDLQDRHNKLPGLPVALLRSHVDS